MKPGETLLLLAVLAIAIMFGVTLFLIGADTLRILVFIVVGFLGVALIITSLALLRRAGRPNETVHTTEYLPNPNTTPQFDVSMMPQGQLMPPGASTLTDMWPDELRAMLSNYPVASPNVRRGRSTEDLEG